MFIQRIIGITIFYLIVCLPLTLLGFPIVALLLLTTWDGKTTWFGNSKWGKGEANPAWFGKTGYWNNFVWLAYRNPINNFYFNIISTKASFSLLKGNPEIGDKIAGGSYYITMADYWEWYYIKPYTVFGSRRCVRIRMGWKIKDVPYNATCPFVFVINPWREYLGK